MQPAHFSRPLYTGFAPHFAGAGLPYPQFMGQHGPCPGCGQPRHKCCCAWRECRKEAKELVVGVEDSASKARQIGTSDQIDPNLAKQMKEKSVLMNFKSWAGAESLVEEGTTQPDDKAMAFIGGGCCVHLSVEYTPRVLTRAVVVAVAARDGDGTFLIWMKRDPAGAGYQVKEGIMMTKPGAAVSIEVTNAVARLRWCEIFSC